MLARTRLRRFVIEALEDPNMPFGPDCECVGPIAVDCDGRPIEILDSPSGFLIDRLTDKGEGSIGLPAIAVYVEEQAITFDGNAEPCVSSTLVLTLEIYVTADEDWAAEDCADDLQERVMYRILRQEPANFNGSEYQTIWQYRPTDMRVLTERQKEDRRIWMRQIEITMTGCDKFFAPDCDPCASECVEVHTPIDC